MPKTLDLSSIEISGIDMKDYPDFVDTHATYATWQDGTELTEEELWDIDPAIIQQMAYEKAF